MRKTFLVVEEAVEAKVESESQPVKTVLVEGYMSDECAKYSLEQAVKETAKDKSSKYCTFEQDFAACVGNPDEAVSGHIFETVTVEVCCRSNRFKLYRCEGRFALACTFEPTVKAVEGDPDLVHDATILINLSFVASGCARLQEKQRESKRACGTKGESAGTGCSECPAVDRYTNKVEKIFAKAFECNGYKTVAAGLGFVGSMRVGDSTKKGHDAIAPEVPYKLGGASAHGTLQPCSFKETAVVETENSKVTGAKTANNVTAGKLEMADESPEDGPEVAPTGLGVGPLQPSYTFGENYSGAHLVNESSICANSTKVHKDDHDMFTKYPYNAVAAGVGNAVTDVVCALKCSGVEYAHARHCCGKDESFVCKEEAEYVEVEGTEPCSSNNFAETYVGEDGYAMGTESAKQESGELDEKGRRKFAVTKGLNRTSDADVATTVTGISFNLSTCNMIEGSIPIKKGGTEVDEGGRIVKEGAPVGGDVAMGLVMATSVTGVGKVGVKLTDEHTKNKQPDTKMKKWVVVRPVLRCSLPKIAKISPRVKVVAHTQRWSYPLEYTSPHPLGVDHAETLAVVVQPANKSSVD